MLAPFARQAPEPVTLPSNRSAVVPPWLDTPTHLAEEGPTHRDEGGLEGVHGEARRGTDDPGRVDGDEVGGIAQRRAGVGGEMGGDGADEGGVDGAGPVEARVAGVTAARGEGGLEAGHGEGVLGHGHACTPGPDGGP